MYLTKDGYKLTGDEVELPDEAELRHVWMITILGEDLKELGREILFNGTPDTGTKMYWIKRYGGRYCTISRVAVLDELGDLPFSKVFIDE